MRTKLFLSLLSLITLFVSTGCKKENNTAPTTAKSTWMLGSQSYTAQTTDVATVPFLDDPIDGENFIITASTNSDDDLIRVAFLDKPTVSGTYTVVDGKGSSLIANTVNVSVDNAAGEFYISTGHAGDKATVTVSGGKITVSFNNITSAEFTTSMQKMVTGNLIEP